jgi:hypothetical protein
VPAGGRVTRSGIADDAWFAGWSWGACAPVDSMSTRQRAKPGARAPRLHLTKHALARRDATHYGRVSLRMNKPAPHAFAHGLGAVRYLEFSKQAFQVRLHCVFGHTQDLAKFAVAQPFPE